MRSIPKRRRRSTSRSSSTSPEIDPIYYDHSYYLAPATGGAKAYRLLLEAMREAGKVAIGKVVIRSKQQLCALRPIGDAMALSTMLFGDEVLSPDRLDELDAVGEAEATTRELKMAQQLIDSLSADFDPAKFKDEYRERVLDLIERKANGEEIAVAARGRGRRPVPDLMAALEASLAGVRCAGSDELDGGEPSSPGQDAQRRRRGRRPASSAKQRPRPGQEPSPTARARRRASTATPGDAQGPAATRW